MLFSLILHVVGHKCPLKFLWRFDHKGRIFKRTSPRLWFEFRFLFPLSFCGIAWHASQGSPQTYGTSCRRGCFSGAARSYVAPCFFSSERLCDKYHKGTGRACPRESLICAPGGFSGCQSICCTRRTCTVCPQTRVCSPWSQPPEEGSRTREEAAWEPSSVTRRPRRSRESLTSWENRRQYCREAGACQQQPWEGCCWLLLWLVVVAVAAVVAPGCRGQCWGPGPAAQWECCWMLLSEEDSAQWTAVVAVVEVWREADWLRLLWPDWCC